MRKPGSAHGFTYMGLVILLAIMGLVSLTAVQIGKVVHRRSAEEALLDVGGEFGQALESYRRATPAGHSESPPSLEALLRDSRLPGNVRHLRKLYEDPMTGLSEWGVLRAEDSKGIIGVFSLSTAKPIKVGNFSDRFRGFAEKTNYQDWVFTVAQAMTMDISGTGKSPFGPGRVSPGDAREDTLDTWPSSRPSFISSSGSSFGSSGTTASAAGGPGLSNSTGSGSAVGTGSTSAPTASTPGSPSSSPADNASSDGISSAQSPTGTPPLVARPRPRTISPGDARDD